MNGWIALLPRALRLLPAPLLSLALLAGPAAHAAVPSGAALRTLTFTDKTGDAIAARDIIGGTASYDPVHGTVSATVQLAAGFSTDPSPSRTLVIFSTIGGDGCDTNSPYSYALTNHNLSGAPGGISWDGRSDLPGTVSGTDSEITVALSAVSGFVNRPWTCAVAMTTVMDLTSGYGTGVLDESSGKDYFLGFGTDSDSDGTADNVDACPTQPGAGADGCPSAGSALVGADPASMVVLQGKRIHIGQLLQRSIATCPARVGVFVTLRGKRLKSTSLPTTTLPTGCQVSGVVVLRNAVPKVRLTIKGAGLAAFSRTISATKT